MRAARYYGRRDVRVEDVPEPQPPGPHEILIEPRLVGICGTDLHEYLEGARVVPTKTHPMTGVKAPVILGHELSAEVLEVGLEVTGVTPGDRGTIMPLASCGRCFFCRRGLSQLCVHHATFGLSYPSGGFAERAVIADYMFVPVPERLSDEQAALVEPAAVAAYAVERGQLQGGESVLVAGAGPIGALVAMYAMAVGAGAVYVSEPNAQRRKLAERLGVTAVFDPVDLLEPAAESPREVGTGVFDPVKSDLTARLRDLTQGVGVDLAIDCAGNQAGLAACINAVRPRGKVVECALHANDPVVDMHGLALKDITLVSTWCYQVYDFARYMALIAAGRFPVEKIITDTIPLEDIVQAGFEALVDPRSGSTKVLVRP